MPTTKIAQRIANLLAKASSTSHEGEAALYLAKARELMDKYQIEFSDLESEKVTSEHTCFRNGNVTPDWDYRLMEVMAKFYDCRAVRTKVFKDGKIRYALQLI